MINKPILPISPFSQTSQNWDFKDAYGRCVVTVKDVAFTEDFGPFKKGDQFAIVEIDVNDGYVAAWKTDKTDKAMGCGVSLVVRTV